MNNNKLKFVVDSRSFDGSCVTTMSDGIHSDYHHETLEELRDREKNPCLTAVSGNTVRKMIRIHLQSLCAPFSEITEERYFDYMDVLPPIRHTRNFFFLGEPYLNPEKPDVPLNKNDAFQKVQKRHVQEKR